MVSYLHQIIIQRPRFSFFLLTFALSWLIWLPAVTPLQGLMSFDVPVWAVGLLLLGAAGPSLAAIIVAYTQHGRSGISALFRSFSQWRVGWHWYVTVIGLPILFFWLTILIHAALTGTRPQLDTSLGWWLLPNLALAFALRFLIALPSGPLAEEMGWRGFALPQLQQRVSGLTASVIIGIAWGVWHLPMFYVPGAALPGGVTIATEPTAVLWYVLGTVGKSILFTWAYNHTGGSLLIDVAFHASINSTANLFLPLVYPDASLTLIRELGRVDLILTWLAALLLIAVCGRHLSPIRSPQPAVWHREVAQGRGRVS